MDQQVSGASSLSGDSCNLPTDRPLPAGEKEESTGPVRRETPRHLRFVGAPNVREEGVREAGSGDGAQPTPLIHPPQRPD